MNKSIQKLVLSSVSLLIVAISLFAFSSTKSDTSINQTMLQNSQNEVAFATVEGNLVDFDIYSYEGGSKCGEGKCGEGNSKAENKKESKKESKKSSKKASKKAGKKKAKKAETKCGAGKCGGGNE